MSTFFSSNYIQNVLSSVLNVYERAMVLKIFIDSNDDELINKYILSGENHNNKLLINPAHIDAGFDLFAPGTTEGGDVLTFYTSSIYDDNNNIITANKLDMKVCCSARMYLDNGKNFNTGYYMYPRSSLTKTSLRLSNSTGIIDAGYRGHLIGMFDVINLPYGHSIYYGKKFDRYLQICAPGLVPIIIEIVNDMSELGEETERGSGGFGSTGR